MPREQVQTPTALQKFVEAAKQRVMDTVDPAKGPMVQDAPIGAGALAAFVRQGFKELGAVLGKATPESVQIDEPGTLANLTPQEVFATKKGLEPGKSMDFEMDR
ncbi:MAG: hypothetical protein HY040_07515 [Planctomycetes bacterium]|nr:hypothetical protein [Planctomycetota bacterium]